MAIGQLDRGPAAEPLHEINVTPLVDVMLVLLIIFIVTAPLLTHKIKLNLPQAKTAAAAVLNPIVISLTRAVQLYVDGQQVTGAQLQQQLRQAVAQGASPMVEVRADGALEYAHVVRLMALVQNAGITRVSFVTAPGTAATELDFPASKSTDESR